MRKLLSHDPSHQMGLFAPSPNPRPHWQDLPADVKTNTLRLLAQLLSAQARRRRTAPHPMEVHNE